MATTAQLTENSRQGFDPEKPDCIGDESDLSRNMHWRYRHVYDETPVGLVVYVRNDPVTRIDKDGNVWKLWCNGPGDCKTIWEDTEADLWGWWIRGHQVVGSNDVYESKPTIDKFSNRVQKEKDTARKKLENANKDCQELFEALGLSASEVGAELSGMDFKDGTTSSELISDVVSMPYATATGTVGWTVSDLFKYGFPPLPANQAVNGWSPLGGTVYLRPGAVSWVLETHETLHQFTNGNGQLNDDFIIQKWGLDPKGLSSQISDKIKEKCN